MTHDQGPGRVFWIDHYVVCTNDIARWQHFNEELLGASPGGQAVVNGTMVGLFLNIGPCRNGGFIASQSLPATKGLSDGLPRYGFYIEAGDVDLHLDRLKRLNVPHTDPMRTSAYGENGVGIRWQDPDGNQFEFWGPDVLPPGAMERRSSVGIGRISHVILESRDLQRTAAFFERYCALRPSSSGDIPSDRLVLPLAAGGRLIFQRVSNLQGRTTGCGLPDTHTALLVKEDDYFPSYSRLWSTLPEIDHDVLLGKVKDNPAELGPCTIMHPSRAGREFKKLTGRGDDWFDCDTNLFHFFGGKSDDASFATYQGKSMQDYINDWREAGRDMKVLVTSGG
jgi:catechol 2,3-dioxygenase-like lactoylglutathione lyase family enzyme